MPCVKALNLDYMMDSKEGCSKLIQLNLFLYFLHSLSSPQTSSHLKNGCHSSGGKPTFPLILQKEREMKQGTGQHCVAYCSSLAPQELQGSSGSYLRTPKWGRAAQPHLKPKHSTPMYALGDYSPVECFPRVMLLFKSPVN